MRPLARFDIPIFFCVCIIVDKVPQQCVHVCLHEMNVRSCSFMCTGRLSRHRRISSWDQGLALKGRSIEGGPMSPANSGDLAMPRPKVLSSH